LEPEKLEGGGEAAEQLKDIASLGEKLESYLGKSGNKDPEIREALSNLRDSIDFIRNINQSVNYLQLPVTINGDNSTTKLYVFKEGKQSRHIDPQDATIVLSLDLSALGHLESMVKVKSRSVNVTFRVETKEIGSIIEKNHELLRQSLKEKGYSLNPVRVISMGQPFSLLSMEAMINGSSSDKIHFDMRV
ncbi:MAG: flagellar hook-length control protein FliK, partial [Pseudomonadota bacterium]